MKKYDLSMIISSCDKFSDLWEGHIRQLDRYWPDRNTERTILLTDRSTDRTYNGITVMAAGADAEWSERLKAALDTVTTEYVFITLDDYFLIKQVDNHRINEMVDIMKEYNLDYVRLYKRPKRATREQIGEHKGIYRVDNSIAYCVNMYAGIWKTEFARFCADCKLSAWEFEVALPDLAVRYQAFCAVDYNKDFVILDVVRKGKLLHKSARYFKTHPELYSGTREINTWRYEIGLWCRTMVARHTPLWLHKRIKQLMRKFGLTFFTKD